MSEGPAPQPRPERGTQRPARVGRDTRVRYLRAAAELAARTSPGQDTFPYAVSAVSMADVAAELGVARTTLYKLWPSKLDFWADLTTFIAAMQLGPTPDEVATSILTHDPGSQTPRSAMEQARIVLNAFQASQLADPWVGLRIALLGYDGNARLHELVASANARDLTEIAAQVERILAALGVAPREPLTARDIAVAGFCVADGLAAGGRLTPRVNTHDITLDDEDPGWGMLAFAIRGIVRRCTRPRTAADDEFRAMAPMPPPVEVPNHWNDAQRAALEVGARQFLAGLADDDRARREHSPLGHITLARLARHAGVSRQSLHRIWPSQHAFASELVMFLFEERCEAILGILRQATRKSMEVPFGGTLVATDMAFAAHIREGANGAQTHLAYASHADEPAISDRGGVVLESMLDRFAADLAALTRSWGGSTRDGVEFFHLATIIVLTELAAARLERTNPGSVRMGLPYRGGEWSALAILMEGIVGYALGLPIEEQPDVDRPGHAL